MKKILIVANWKSNKTESEATDWLRRFKIDDLRFTNKEIVICPPFVHLPILKSYFLNHKSAIRLGAQDISPFGEGAYTGEISASLVKEFADFVIIGHSERRINFGETDEELFRKNDLAKASGLITIFCVQGKETKVPANVDIVAYEPINAIGTGHPDSPKNADDVASFLKTNYNVKHVLYGGSVVSDNVQEFTQMSNIDGVLIGRASLDAKEFYEIIQNA